MANNGGQTSQGIEQWAISSLAPDLAREIYGQDAGEPSRVSQRALAWILVASGAVPAGAVIADGQQPKEPTEAVEQFSTISAEAVRYVIDVNRSQMKEVSTQAAVVTGGQDKRLTMVSSGAPDPFELSLGSIEQAASVEFEIIDPIVELTGYELQPIKITAIIKAGESISAVAMEHGVGALDQVLADESNAKYRDDPALVHPGDPVVIEITPIVRTVPEGVSAGEYAAAISSTPEEAEDLIKFNSEILPAVTAEGFDPNKVSGGQSVLVIPESSVDRGVAAVTGAIPTPEKGEEIAHHLGYIDAKQMAEQNGLPLDADGRPVVTAETLIYEADELTRQVNSVVTEEVEPIREPSVEDVGSGNIEVIEVEEETAQPPEGEIEDLGSDEKPDASVVEIEVPQETDDQIQFRTTRERVADQVDSILRRNFGWEGSGIEQLYNPTVFDKDSTEEWLDGRTQAVLENEDPDANVVAELEISLYKHLAESGNPSLDITQPEADGLVESLKEKVRSDIGAWLSREGLSFTEDQLDHFVFTIYASIDAAVSSGESKPADSFSSVTGLNKDLEAAMHDVAALKEAGDAVTSQELFEYLTDGAYYTITRGQSVEFVAALHSVSVEDLRVGQSNIDEIITQLADPSSPYGADGGVKIYILGGEQRDFDITEDRFVDPANRPENLQNLDEHSENIYLTALQLRSLRSYDERFSHIPMLDRAELDRIAPLILEGQAEQDLIDYYILSEFNLDSQELYSGLLDNLFESAAAEGAIPEFTSQQELRDFFMSYRFSGDEVPAPSELEDIFTKFIESYNPSGTARAEGERLAEFLGLSDEKGESSKSLAQWFAIVNGFLGDEIASSYESKGYGAGWVNNGWDLERRLRHAYELFEYKHEQRGEEEKTEYGPGPRSLTNFRNSVVRLIYEDDLENPEGERQFSSFYHALAMPIIEDMRDSHLTSSLDWTLSGFYHPIDGRELGGGYVADLIGRRIAAGEITWAMGQDIIDDFTLRRDTAFANGDAFPNIILGVLIPDLMGEQRLPWLYDYDASEIDYSGEIPQTAHRAQVIEGVQARLLELYGMHIVEDVDNNIDTAGFIQGELCGGVSGGKGWAWCACTVSNAHKEGGIPFLHGRFDGGALETGVIKLSIVFKNDADKVLIDPEKIHSGEERFMRGDVLFYRHWDKDYNGHVTVVHSVNDDGTITTLGGNEDDTVSRRTFTPFGRDDPFTDHNTSLIGVGRVLPNEVGWHLVEVKDEGPEEEQQLPDNVVELRIPETLEQDSLTVIGEAAEAEGANAALLMAIHRTEVRPSSDINDRGYLPYDSDWEALSTGPAKGPFQFLPGTWEGYGRDADGDGVANIFSFKDSAYAAAAMVAEKGGVEGIPLGSIYDDFSTSLYHGAEPTIVRLAVAYNAGSATYALDDGTWVRDLDGVPTAWDDSYPGKQKEIDNYIRYVVHEYQSLTGGEVPDWAMELAA